MQSIHDTLKATDADLQQLDVMLNHHCERLIAAFEGAIDAVDAVDGDSQAVQSGPYTPAKQAHTSTPIQQVRQQLSQAVLHLQFQDISSQLLSHCQARLQACQTLLVQVEQGPLSATDTMAMPALKGPVSHASLDAGTVDLFDTPAHPPIQGDSQ